MNNLTLKCNLQPLVLFKNKIEAIPFSCNKTLLSNVFYVVSYTIRGIKYFWSVSLLFHPPIYPA